MEYPRQIRLIQIKVTACTRVCNSRDVNRPSLGRGVLGFRDDPGLSFLCAEVDLSAASQSRLQTRHCSAVGKLVMSWLRALEMIALPFQS